MTNSPIAILWKYLLLFITFLGLVRCQGWVYSGRGCRTPSGGTGDCIPVRQCRPMLEALRTAHKPLSPSVSKQLNAYYCSFKNNVPNVCCPQGPIIIQDDSPEVEQQPPDVTYHRNSYLLPTDCGYLDPNDRIREGEDADLNEFPWMALISYRTRTSSEFKCGGTIINDRYILTAAHCITNLKTPLLGVRVGEYDTGSDIDCVTNKNGSRKCNNDPVQDLAIEEIIPHPQFDPNKIANDIGLLRVARMNLNAENARPVCLPNGEHRNKKFNWVTVTGWGVTDVITDARSNILQKVNLAVVSLDRCKNIYKDQSKASITYKQVCAGGKDNKDSCKGDSGGPLHVAGLIGSSARYIQHGVVSFGPSECGFEGFPGVYTRVAYYMDWILDNLRP